MFKPGPLTLVELQEWNRTYVLPIEYSTFIILLVLCRTIEARVFHIVAHCPVIYITWNFKLFILDHFWGFKLLDNSYYGKKKEKKKLFIENEW